MRKLILSMVSILFLLSANAHASSTIVAVEEENDSMANGRVDIQKGRFEHTYVIDGNTITRTMVRDLATNQVYNNNTVYTISSEKMPESVQNIPQVGPMVQALATSDPTTIDVLMIDKTSVRSFKVKGNVTSLSLQKRVK